MLYLIKSIFIIVLLIIVFGIARTWQVQHRENQALFIDGKIPNPKPDGLYNGTVPGYKVSWLGKKFNATDSNGVNVFDDGNSMRGERYPFHTSVGKGIRDK